ncbi:MAG TPA: hypothetical protein VK563_10300 [Puia sp.]|nr:hypothetical protein [Puia sp.]
MDAFGHIKSVIAIILGLSIAKLLQGAVKFIQHPGRNRPYWVHLLWALYLFLLLVHFWWWEYGLRSLAQWQFQEYLFIIVFITLYFALCALLFPDDVNDYEGSFADYFFSRRKWFYGVLAITFVADLVDTAMKGKEYLMHFGWEYPVRNAVHIVLCLVAIRVTNRSFHAMLVILFILYELSYIFRLFGTAS